MDDIYLIANAKINVTLEIVGKRMDGYHDLRSIMQTISLCDSLYIFKQHKGISFDTDMPSINNCDNLVYKATKYLIDRYKIDGGVRLYLRKRIPVAAGLGGGSSDCAAVIRGMNKLFQLGFSTEDMIRLGKLFGSDVPFFIMQGTALAEGRGEILNRLPDHPKAFVLVVKPEFDVSTKDIFTAYKPDAAIPKPDTGAILDSFKRGELSSVCSNLCNMLESVTIPLYPVINDIKEMMVLNGAKGALMSGSGPSVFGYFPDKISAALAGANIRKAFPNLHEVHVSQIKSSM